MTRELVQGSVTDRMLRNSRTNYRAMGVVGVVVLVVPWVLAIIVALGSGLLSGNFFGALLEGAQVVGTLFLITGFVGGVLLSVYFSQRRKAMVNGHEP